VVERSPHQKVRVACLAGSFVNRPIFLAYRQRMANLGLLRPLSLVETVVQQCKDQTIEQEIAE
jgi:hypothetical protein